MADSIEPKVEKTEENKTTTRGIKPLVFISHDTRDAELAEAFSKLLSSVSAGVLNLFVRQIKEAIKELHMELNGIQK